MSAIAVNAAVAAPVPTATAAPATNHASDETGFAALLGEMAKPKSKAAESQPDPAAKDRSEAPALSALQSLEAALNGFGPLAAAPAKAGEEKGAAAPSRTTAPLG